MHGQSQTFEIMFKAGLSITLFLFIFDCGFKPFKDNKSIKEKLKFKDPF